MGIREAASTTADTGGEARRATETAVSLLDLLKLLFYNIVYLFMWRSFFPAPPLQKEMLAP